MLEQNKNLEKIMKNHGEVEQMAPARWFVNFGNNKLNENILVEVSICENDGSKYALPKLWKKNGWMDHELKTWIHLMVYVTDPSGLCHGKYNPTEKAGKINFQWVLEATPENLEKLLTEVERRAGLM